MDERYTVDLQPVGRRAHIAADETLLDAARQSGVALTSVCGGIGACDTCRVQLVSGRLTAPSMAEEALFSPTELGAGWRLACQASPQSDVRLDIPPECLGAAQRLQVEGEAVDLDFAPSVRPLDVTIPPASIHAPHADDVRLRAVLRAHALPDVVLWRAALCRLPDSLQAGNGRVRVIVRDERDIIAILPPSTAVFGLAFDIGTTGMAGYLVDLQSGEIRARAGAMNPQIAYGEDVVSRIMYANQHQDGALQTKLVASLNGLIDTLCHTADATPEQIVDVVAVGNTAMHHLFAGLPVRQLGEAPYAPVVQGALRFPAGDVGLRTAAGAVIYMPPNIAGYVGADHVAMLAAIRAWQPDSGVRLAIDIGTNTELTLSAGGRHLACSCASGPAFEGAHIRDGMRAAPGAIERVRLIDGEVFAQTIDDQPATGICGSGILEAISGLAANGKIDQRGAFTTSGESAFLLVAAEQTGHGRDIIISRKDIAEIQLAKAAIAAGITVLLQKVGLNTSDIERVIIAGAFGTYIDLAGAVQIGMLPDVALDRFEQIGNAAGVGAWQFLLSRHLREQAEALVADVDYIELTTEPDFQHLFIDSMALRPM
ncbi:MAG: DUF4445 domain-containing protein [Anaerolineaceae bacterium]|nr:MAG: DUF4445 domain-containing protein [Anaerolineaceae bacterium]